MTEKEAREKWCPMVRYNYCGSMDGVPATDSNRKIDFEQFNCIASDCMMWRWVRNDYADGYQPQEGHDEYDKGYCGLGGRV